MWSHQPKLDPFTCNSQTGFVISHAGCPILWKIKVQTLITLSTTEAEYIALSTALYKVIDIIYLMEYLKCHSLPLCSTTPILRCKKIEDSMSCEKMANNHTTWPCTKHLTLRLHHFHSHIVNKIITVKHISTKDQIADVFHEPLPKPIFLKIFGISSCLGNSIIPTCHHHSSFL